MDMVVAGLRNFALIIAIIGLMVITFGLCLYVLDKLCSRDN